jgi:ArsR family transcriptional regulator
MNGVDILFGDQVEQAGLRFCAELLDSLGHPTRLRIAYLLRKSPLTVNAISTELNIPQANVSQHLAVMTRAGALTKESAGTARLYSLREPGLAKILDKIEAFWQVHREDIAAERVG